MATVLEESVGKGLVVVDCMQCGRELEMDYNSGKTGKVEGGYVSEIGATYCGIECAYKEVNN